MHLLQEFEKPLRVYSARLIPPRVDHRENAPYFFTFAAAASTLNASGGSGTLYAALKT